MVVKGCAFYENKAGSLGGAILAEISVIVVIVNWPWSMNNMTHNAEPIIERPSLSNSGVTRFCNNKAYGGGAITTYNGLLTLLSYSLFSENIAAYHGGAVYLYYGNFALSSSSFFANNASISGGAVEMNGGNFELSGSTLFSRNKARHGGAIYTKQSTILLRGIAIKFELNAAVDGGGVYSTASALQSTSTTLNFVRNVASKRGGALWIKHTLGQIVILSSNFTDNSATTCGGAVYTGAGINIHFKGFVAIRNSGSALCLLENNKLNFSGTTNFSGKFGGGIKIASRNSMLYFTDYTVFDSNGAFIGGAIYSLYETKLMFSGFVLFTHNTADRDGGALYALGTDIIIKNGNILSFVHNSAENGGAMYLNSATFLIFSTWVNVSTSHNRASRYGGAIFYEVAAISTQCNYADSSDQAEISRLPYCFLNFTSLPYAEYLFNTDTKAFSCNDSAGKDGSFLYGGLLDRCQLHIEDEQCCALCMGNQFL